MKMHKLTYALLFLVLITFGFTFGSPQQTPVDQARLNKYLKQQQDQRLRFPIADYEEAELADPKKNQALKEKKLRKNDVKLVARKPPAWAVEVVSLAEGEWDFPSLPVAQSDVVVLGRVTTAEAHLSENKKNVYSEFKVVVEKIFKSASSSTAEGTEITVDRIGGFVRYAKGQTVLYRISGTNMPATGERYLFFLTSKNQQDLSILTAYELTDKGVLPLDQSSQFEMYRGVSETSLIQHLRESLAKSSSH